MKSLVDLLGIRSKEAPERLLYTFLRDGESEFASYTYAELDRRARAIAAVLQGDNVPGDRALLLFPPGLDFISAFFGCLYAGVVAVPAYPPRPNQGLAKLRSIALDARPAVALTTAAIAGKVMDWVGEEPGLAALRWLPVDQLDAAALARAEVWRDPGVGADTLAFLQYTSGSTGDPKGVMVSHGNLLHNESAIRQGFRQTGDSVIVGWLPLYHDMGLIGNVLQPLYVGGRCMLMSSSAFLQKPLRWLEAISRYRGTTSGGPNFAYELCLRKITAEQRATLRLDSWTVAYNGAEPVREETMVRFAEAFAACGFRREAFYPCYGLAEGTLFVTGGAAGTWPSTTAVEPTALERGRVEPAEEGSGSRRLVSNGSPWQEQQVAIVDPETLRRCPLDQVGEIWVSGASVAQGYWERSEVTEQVFRARIAGEEDGTTWLRTGDLGFLYDGELFVTGRLKDLIIIRGRNHYPQDLELTVERSHPALRAGCGAAFAVEVDGEERLVVVQEVERRSRVAADCLEEMASAVRQAVAAEHDLHVHEIVLVPYGGIPKTSSGKIQRQACRRGWMSGDLGDLPVVGRRAAAPDTALLEGEPVLDRGSLLSLPLDERIAAVESFLRRRMARLAGVDPARISPEQRLTAFGLDSLMSVELKAHMEEELGVGFSLAALLEGASLRDVVLEILSRLEKEDEQAVRLVAAGGGGTAEMPLSYGQKSLWFLHNLAPQSGAYHIAAAVRVRSLLDPTALHRALQALTARHPALRTTFAEAEEGPLQWVHRDLEVDFATADLSALEEEALRERLADEAYAPFDLAQGPLFRVRAFGRPGEYLLLFSFHHIVADFWTLGILARELGALYSQETGGAIAGLPPLAITYSDYVTWQELLLAEGPGSHGLEHWLAELGSGVEDLDLPADHLRPAVQTWRGAAEAARLPQELLERARVFARERGTTLHTVLLTAFQTLLHRLSGQDTVVVGSPAAGRTAAALRTLAGYFVNPVILRADCGDDPAFEDLLAQSHRRVLLALEHQNYPFVLLAERLRPSRDPSRSPLFQAMLVLYTVPDPTLEILASFAVGAPGVSLDLGGLTLEPFPLKTRWSQLDLTLAVVERDGALFLQYNADLFEPARMRRLLRQFETLLAGGVAAPEQRLSDLPLLSAAEREQIAAWNRTEADLDTRTCIHELVEAQVERTPDAPAVRCAEEEWTYRELDARANQLGHHLRSLGVGPERLVGVCLERSLDLVSGLLGVLKAGGAYVPLDPSYPAERLGAMIEDARLSVILTHDRLVNHLPPHGARVIRVDKDDLAGEPAGGLESGVSPDHLAYAIFTSGSTGRPKGVMNTHRGVVNRLTWLQREHPLGADDRVLQKTPFGFDVSVWEFFWPLLSGACLVMARPEGHQDPRYLVQILEREGITTAHFVPSMLQVFLEEPEVERCVALRRVVCSGEALSGDLVERFFAHLGARLFNLYGPTEAAIEVTAWECERGVPRRAIPIGRPIANTRIHLLDARLHPVPVGIPGELSIGGMQVARGYLGRPELTAERFVPDPFGDGGRLYRTGDLVRWMPDGVLEFLGRIDHQVKIRGFRVELGEIEAALASLPEVREAVVLALGEGADRRLVAYLVGAELPKPAALRDHLAARLPAYMVPSTFVELDALPLLANGKVDRRALSALAPERLVPAGAAGTPRTPVEELVAGIWAGVLGRERVGVHDSFFDLGGHSLLATRVASRVREAFGVELPVRAVFEAPTVTALAERVELLLAGPREVTAPLRPALRTGALPLSFAQERLWFLDRFEPGSPLYNIPIGVRLRGSLDPAALAAALSRIVHRHEALRTRFAETAAGPVQVIEPAAPVALPAIDLRHLPETERRDQAEPLARAEAEQPFDLAAGPLLRALLLRLGDAEHWLLLTLHHIAADGWSMGVLVRELSALYTALVAGETAPLPELPVQYADFAVWQREWLRGEELECQIGWWRDHLAGAPERLELPADRLRPAVRTHRGGLRSAELPVEVARGVRALARRTGATPFMVLLAAFQALLGRMSGQTDLTVGTPIANRTQVETEELIGFFVNTLVLRCEMAGDPGFGEMVERARTAALGAYTHQAVPFEKIVEALAPDRDLGSTPLFQVMLILQNAPLPALELPGLALELFDVHTGRAKLDLTLAVVEMAEGFGLALEYDAELFDGATVDRLLACFTALLAGAVAAPELALSRLPVMPETERRQVLLEWADGGPEIGSPELLHTRFVRVAAERPQAIALSCGGMEVTYGDLDRRSDRLARHLRALGVGPEERVGVCLERSPELIVALLAVLKAGGAYVPMDPAYPAERLAFMAEDSAARVVVTQESLQAAAVLDETVPLCGALSASPAYIIYTSGSTGRPKGVAITHANASALISWAAQAFSAEELSGVLAATSVCFDLSVFEIFAPLSLGGTVILAPDALHLPLLPQAERVRLVNTVPSAMAELVRSGGVPQSVRTVILAGEPLPRRLAEELYGLGVERVLDLYGPSEDTTYSTGAAVVRGEERAPTIGRPIAGTRAYVLDRSGEAVAVGVPGELYLAGAGLARGYLGRPELTAERFVPDPFGDGGRLYRTGDLVRWMPDGAPGVSSGGSITRSRSAASASNSARSRPPWRACQRYGRRWCWLWVKGPTAAWWPTWSVRSCQSRPRCATIWRRGCPLTWCRLPSWNWTLCRSSPTARSTAGLSPRWRRSGWFRLGPQGPHGRRWRSWSPGFGRAFSAARGSASTTASSILEGTRCWPPGWRRECARPSAWSCRCARSSRRRP